MSFLRSAFLAVGGFDERFRHGAEENDFCRRLLNAFPGRSLVFVPAASVVHHFEASLRKTLKRNYAYGRGVAQFYRKWPTARPTFFPGPVVFLMILGMTIRFPELAIAALAIPQALYPSGIRSAIARRRLSCLVDSYVQLVQESSEDVGFIHGLWCFRHLHIHPSKGAVLALSEAQEAQDRIKDYV